MSDQHGRAPGTQPRWPRGFYLSQLCLPSTFSHPSSRCWERTRLLAPEAVQPLAVGHSAEENVKKINCWRTSGYCLEPSALCDPFVLSGVNVQGLSSAACMRALWFEGDQKLCASRSFRISGSGFAFSPVPLVLCIFILHLYRESLNKRALALNLGMGPMPAKGSLCCAAGCVETLTHPELGTGGGLLWSYSSVISL